MESKNQAAGAGLGVTDTVECGQQVTEVPQDQSLCWAQSVLKATLPHQA